MSEQKIDYYYLYKRSLKLIKESGTKPVLVLHTCCAPCLAYPLQILVKYFKVHVYFYNPNIFPYEEHQKRYEEVRKYIMHFRLKYPDANYRIWLNGSITREEYEDNLKWWMKATKEYAEEKEGGARCAICFKYRLEQAIEFADSNKEPYLMTTLTSSRHKDSDLINEIGIELQKHFENTTYIPSDFKKDDGELRSREICKEYGIYRQNYCGCYFSLLPKLPN